MLYSSTNGPILSTVVNIYYKCTVNPSTHLILIFSHLHKTIISIVKLTSKESVIFQMLLIIIRIRCKKVH